MFTLWKRVPNERPVGQHFIDTEHFQHSDFTLIWYFGFSVLQTQQQMFSGVDLEISFSNVLANQHRSLTHE